MEQSSIKYHRILNLILAVFIFLAIISLLTSFVFNQNFFEKHISQEKLIGEHLEMRINIFQKQMFYLTIFFSFIGLLTWIFRKKILKFLCVHPKFLINLTVLLITLIGIFLVGEMLIRMFFSEKIYNEYTNGPGSVKLLNNIDYNLLGYRDIEHHTAKDEHVYRILFLGDSFTFGSGIKNLEDTYPKLIEKMLNIEYDSIKVEAVIFAKEGYSVLDELNALKRKGLSFEPDLIILGYFLNDAEEKGSKKGYEDLLYAHYIIPYELGDLMYKYSLFYYFLESRLKKMIGSRKSYEDYIEHLYSDSNPYFKQHKKDLEELIKIANTNKIPLLVIMIPSPGVDFKDYPYLKINKYIQEISESNRVSYLDLLPYFQEYEPKDIRISLFDAHMNELGHKIMAYAVLDYLQKNSLLA